jgi:MtN3 and saliva related transmembrane protein
MSPAMNAALFSWFGGAYDAIGTVAACLTTASFLPQAWLTFRTRDARGVSLAMYSAFAIGVSLWLAYGLLLGSWPMVAANGFTLVLALAILAMRLLYAPGRAASPGTPPGRASRHEPSSES